jgi:hypothetical protein
MLTDVTRQLFQLTATLEMGDQFAGASLFAFATQSIIVYREIETQGA